VDVNEGGKKGGKEERVGGGSKYNDRKISLEKGVKFGLPGRKVG